MKKISLVFPVYNVAAYVRDSLLSALEQSYSNIEYLIIDDRGTDNSMDIVNDIVNSHSRKEAIRIIKHPKNRGLGGTRNTAILEATGEYLFFLDSDDILLNNAIELLVDLLKEDDYDMIAASFERVINEKSEMFCLPDNALIGKNEIVSTYFAKKSCYEMIWGKLYKLSFLREHNLNFIEFCNHEDTPFTFHLMLCLNKIRLSSSIIYQWRFRENSVTSVYKEKNISDLFLGFVYMACILPKYLTDDNYIEMLRYVNNFRLFPIWLLLKGKVLTDDKNNLLVKFSVPLLSFNDVLRMPLSCSEKMKHFIFLLPYKLKWLLLSIIVHTQKI